MSPLRSPLLAAYNWLDHGFGTRDDGYWTPQSQTATLHQVHGNEVAVVDRPGHHGDGDALLTKEPGLWLEIRTADCVPLLLIDPANRAIGAVHAGWRGTTAQIARVAVESMTKLYGTRPEDLRVAIGPFIGPCCFEVGDEVAEHFPNFTSRSTARPHVDLGAANLAQLMAAGVPQTQIELPSLCTVCDPTRFHSFRRDRSDGRMISAAAIRP